MSIDSIVAGMTILSKYYPDGGKNVPNAEHDVIYMDETPIRVSEEDYEKLIELRWTQYDVLGVEQFANYADYDPNSQWEFRI